MLFMKRGFAYPTRRPRNSSSDQPFAWPSEFRRVIFRLVLRFLPLSLALAGGLAGCSVTKKTVIPQIPVAPRPASATESKLPSGSAPTSQAVSGHSSLVPLYNSVAEVQILRLRLPLGRFTGNKKIWRILSPVAADRRTRHLLAANGIRSGTASFKQWRHIAPWLNKPGTTSQRIYCQLSGIHPVTVTVRSNVRRELLAYVNAKNALTVRSFQNCDNDILLAAHLLEHSPDTVMQLEPAVRLGTVTFTRGPHALGLIQGTRPVEHLFPQLQMTVQIAPRHFVVLAAADAAGRPAAIGSAFLSETRRVPPRETVLLFIPMNGVK